MTESNNDHENKSVIDLKMLSQEELESKVDILLAKCRAEVNIKTTAEKGAMFRKGPFQISIALAIKMKKYQDDLLYCRTNPYDVLLSVCADNGWSTPEFRAVDYMPGEGFLFSVVVNNHELVSKWRNRRPLLAADLASANFLRYLGLWVNVRNLDLFFDWEHITDEETGTKNKEIGDLNGYLYFMGFNVVDSEATDDKQSTLTSSVFSLRPNIQLQLTKLMYVFLVSRGEKTCWLTDIDFAFFRKLFGDLKPDATYVFSNESWRSQVACSCPKKGEKICFLHDENFFCHILKDYYYVDKFGPVSSKVLKKLKKIYKEEEEAKSYIKETSQETKTFIHKNTLKNTFDFKEKEGLFLNNTCLPTSKNLPMSSITKLDITETPIDLRTTKFDLRSKIFGAKNVEETVEEEKEDYKITFDNTTGLSNVKSSLGSWISVVDISPRQIPQPAVLGKRACSVITTVVTSKRKKKKNK